MSRPTLDETLMSVATACTAWSRRSTCQRLQVGAVLARDGRTISTGYNGTPTGENPCKCAQVTQCERAVHAELNCLLFAARHGVSSLGATMYCTDSPCSPCAAAMINAGIAEVVYSRPYRLYNGLSRLEDAGITVRRLG